MTEPRTDDLKSSRRHLFGIASGAALLGSLGVASAARAARPPRPAPESPAPQES
ncbi:hypothetical protein [Catenuloplanes indicus]|uniref:Uncharacterized protein n=1 Tax=Catenuloplanes indicus TaxID=137267 RepID=A0AAE3W270_9ACTN|nr:hypothetical protein [Catenuloplanes indicus]MDQ0368109.1 hypothetical protein [Catenuloplanes indicus]